MFEVEYLWNGWVKKDGINPNLILAIQPKLLSIFFL